MSWKIVIDSGKCDRRERLDCIPGQDFFYCYEISKECTEQDCPLRKEATDEQV